MRAHDHATQVTFVVPDEAQGERLDRFLSVASTWPRNQVARKIEAGEVFVEGSPCTKPAHKVRSGDVIVAHVLPPRPAEAAPEALPLDVVYEDQRLLVLNKAAGVVVHPAPGHPAGTLVNALLHHCTALSGIGGVLRPGIVHRLDKETSGLLVISKDDQCHAHLQAQFAEHSVRRSYLAIVAQTQGPRLPDQGSFDTGHGRHPTERKRFSSLGATKRRAVTHFEVIERFRDQAMLLRLRLETGRTHQIRMHLSEAGAALLGDALYGGRAHSTTRLITRVALHAETLGFSHPEGQTMEWTAAPPPDFQGAVDTLRRGASWRT